MNARVLITRPAGAWPGLAARFQGTPVQIEMAETTTQVEPIDPRPGDEAVGRLDRYDWLVVTSARGVSAFARRLGARGKTGLPPGLRIAVVGPATARAFEDLGVRVDLVADEATSEGIGSSLRARLVGAARVLVIRPEGTQGPLAAVLRDGGADVDEAPLYRTVASERAAELADQAIAGRFAAVVFTAPSSCDLWLHAAGLRREALHGALAGVARVAIGPTTAARLASLGLPAAAVAVTPREDAVGDAIARVLPAFDLLP